MRIKIVLAAVLTLTALAVGVVLAHSPTTVAATNGIEPTAVVGIVTRAYGACQSAETLPADTAAIRLDVDAPIGPQVSVAAYAAGRLLTRGSLGTGWYGSAVSVPVAPRSRTFAHVTVCFRLRAVDDYLALRGANTRPDVALVAGGRRLSGRIGIEYLRRSRESWWSQAGAVIRHMGLGRAASGIWIAPAVAALTASAIALASWVIVREFR